MRNATSSSPAADRRDATAPARGIRASAGRVAEHLGSLARLERELARSELRRKGARLGTGAGLGLAAGILLPYALGFGLAATAAALALALDLWLALLIVFGGLTLLVLVLALVARSLLRSGKPLRPEQAIEEAGLTRQALGGPRGG